MAKKSVYDKIMDKYKSMTYTRKEYKDIDIDDYLPDIADMIKEDCVWDVLKDMSTDVNGGKDDVKDAAYYSEKPPILEPGYYPEEACFVLRCKKPTILERDMSLGELDGDTWYFDIDDLDTGGDFTINGKVYKNYKEYAQANKIDCKKLTVKSCSVEAPEICHYTVAIETKDTKIETMSYKTAKIEGHMISPQKIERHYSKNPDKWTIVNYKDDEKVKILFPSESKIGYQIIDDIHISKAELGSLELRDKNAKLHVVVGYADKSWASSTIRDGYKAQARVKELLNHAQLKDIITILDKNLLLGKRTKGSIPIYYNSIFFLKENYDALITDLYSNISNTKLSQLSFSPFGCDKYGHAIGNTWVKIGTKQGDTWINLSKYVLTGTEFGEANPSFNNQDLNGIYSGVSDVFKQWTNASNVGRYVDELDANGADSYDKRIQLHKELTGIDFTGEARNCTVLIGDCLFMLPPQAIRHSTSLDYEKAPIIRGKGSMAKSRTNLEELIELELYFNADYGINGIEYKTTTPNGTNITYYMNGLRALVAQFKVAPFLPIENHYINDILNIEAVSLVSLNMSTVEGFPHLLRAVLTLRDFNYRVFMPDLPLPTYAYNNGTINQLEPVFAKQFDWELFRYYYQRGIIFGEELNTKTYNTFEYGEYLYSHKNTYTPANLNSSDFEIYVPDVTWLKTALQIKKAREQNGVLNPDPDNVKGDGSDNTNQSTGEQLDVEILNGNKPTSFSAEDKKNTGKIERYGNLDIYGRCTSCFAIVSKDTMPKNEREPDLTSVTPTGYKNTKYDFIDGGYIYNRCHLIGYQLTGGNYTSKESIANPKNLITGTRYFNATLMLFYENKVANYVKKNNCHVLYKVTPVYEGNNLVASGVKMEAYSVEDNGKLQFNVYLRNVQEFIKIDYATGDTQIDEVEKAKHDKTLFDCYDYKNPKNMKFVPYVQDGDGNSVPFELDGISMSMGNVFTETHLKAVDGYAPQFMGGTDIVIEMNMTVTSEYYIGLLNGLPHLAMNMIRNYRRVMPCFPIRIKNEYLQMLGVNECLIDNIETNTKEGMPGVYEVNIRLSSVDRTTRSREALQKVNAPNKQTSGSAENAIADYFELNRTLSQAELYPDLDLPTISELEQLGWKFAKWVNEDRVYVDPDFYVCYSFQYSSKLIKQVVNNVLCKVSYAAGINDKKAKEEERKLTAEEEKLYQRAKTLNCLVLADDSGMSMKGEVTGDANGVSMDNLNGFSSLYDTIMTDAQEKASQDTAKKARQKKEQKKIDTLKVVGNALEYLTASGIENGWQITPGWYAPLCDDYLNKELKKFKYSGIKQKSKPNEEEDALISEIYDIRHRALMLINRVLDKPLKLSDDTGTLPSLDKAVNTLFENEDFNELMLLLNPMAKYVGAADVEKGGKVDIDNHTYEVSGNESIIKLGDSATWKLPNMRTYIKGYLYALACTRSGKNVYGINKVDNNWTPNQWQNKCYSEKDKEAMAAGKQYKRIPYVIIEGQKSGGELPCVEEYKDIEKYGMAFGLGQIKRYSRASIKRMMQPSSKVTYFNKNYKTGAAEYYNNMYYKTKKAGRKNFCESGFIDQYYNYAGYNSAEGKDYIKRISHSEAANYEALLREVLMHLKRMIMDGYFFSELDIISQDWEKVSKEILDVKNVTDVVEKEQVNEQREEKWKNIGNIFNLEDMWNEFLKTISLGLYQTDKSWQKEDDYLANAKFNLMNAGLFGYDALKKEYDDAVEYATLSEAGLTPDLIKNLRTKIPESYAKLFCSRMIYPFISAATEGSDDFYKIIEERDYDTLNTYTSSVTIGAETGSKLTKFLNALYGIKMIGSSDVMDSAESTSNTQKAFNTLMGEAFTALSNDPRCYTLHAMYDMCTTDKRGRLLRAFPCYYIMFVDEGRMIGTWKIFDNFYNMSSISEIQVVKSRKIPADTCKFTMSNMYMSYTDTYDNSIYQQYVNAYGFKDLFSSIFVPRGYVEKEDMIRRRKQLLDTQPLSPGVRIHVRMGYGADASALPIAFNGKVAEVSCGETIEIVAQGDGHELNNPLNTLGELTARNLEESQDWCTLFKDIRGSLCRGGETPRNLLAKLSTAQYGGLQGIVRDFTGGRFFYDNPFGIYHFGDKRFRDIFEDSEIVQNMYEVSNHTILNGTNDLFDDESTVRSSPILNCNIQDKTLWEIGHLCANAGDDYTFAVRDFGLRSSMCLCKNNHYYAYAYDKNTANDVIVEKRKPFQQWHYYDSFNDIIYNSIKASETNMKTNAVGVWEGSNFLWGKGQQSVGPIYLDMNIYPEYQKSMTVETGLVAGGAGGINIPMVNALAEKFNLDEYAGRVNKSVVEKVTTNVLRESVKDMYEGEMCVIGDSSLKPYDRVTMVDMYEDLTGDVEVETVIHSMNMETGFTTTFVPDLIVKGENTTQEIGHKHVLGSVVLSLIGAVTGRGLVLHNASKATNGLLKLGKLKNLIKAGEVAEETVEAASVLTKFAEKIESASMIDAINEGSWASVMAAFKNPVGLTATAVAATSIFIFTANVKETFFRALRNIQALSVFPIIKNNRPMVAGMSGHKGSVYGYSYDSSLATNNRKDSIQNYIMDFLKEDQHGAGSIVRFVFDNFLLNDDYDKVTNKWLNNLGFNDSADVINKDASSIRNQEAFYQSVTSSLSKEYTSRAAALAALKVKPRIRKFNTNNRTSEAYLNYQIGGVYDKKIKDKNNEKIYSYVSSGQLANNARIKSLLPIEDEPDIKIALNEGVHPVIKIFKIAHAKSTSKFNLMMENENTQITYIVTGKGDNQIYDLPMLHEDALTILKLIINDEHLEGKTVTFLSGTRVNDTRSWKSTGLAFSLASDDITALEEAIKAVKNDCCMVNDDNNGIFDYKANKDSIEVTVKAPMVVFSNSKGDD